MRDPGNEVVLNCARGSGNTSDRKSASRRGQYGGNRRGLLGCTDLAVQHRRIFFRLVDYWNGAEGQRSTASCDSTFFFFYVTVLRENEIPLSNEVGKISDFNRYEQPYGFWYFFICRSRFILILGITIFRVLQNLHVFLTGTITVYDMKEF